jgi:hypothetical protein
MIQKMPQQYRYIIQNTPSAVKYNWSSNANLDFIICKIPKETDPYSKSS